MYSFTDAPDTASSDEEELVDDDDVVVFSVLPPHATILSFTTIIYIVKYFSILFEIIFTMFLVVNKKMYEKNAQFTRKIVQFI